MEKVVGLSESNTELQHDKPSVEDVSTEWKYVQKAPVQKTRNRLVVPGSHLSIWCGNMHDIPQDQIVMTTSAKLIRQVHGAKMESDIMPWEIQNGLGGIAHQAIYALAAEEDELENL